tara:strand:- start:226 stop:414 length:189 start_codon:yes stop_codon:yes gene_type:complete
MNCADRRGQMRQKDPRPKKTFAIQLAYLKIEYSAGAFSIIDECFATHFFLPHAFFGDALSVV